MTRLLVVILFALSAVFAETTPTSSSSSKTPPSSSSKKKEVSAASSSSFEMPPKPKGNSKLWKIIVSIKDQHVYVYKEGKLVRDMLCSSGTAGHPTPTGTFTLNEGGTLRGLKFTSKKYGGWSFWYVAFFGHSYLFHAVPGSFNGKMSESSLKKLGTRASHGCIRLLDTEAKWLWSTVPDGTVVTIQDKTHKVNGKVPETI